MDRIYAIGGSHKREAETGDLIVEMAFASEQPYERWWGVEVLDMKGARLGRLNDADGGPVLFNHNWNDLRGRHMPGSVRADKDGVLRGQISIPQATQATRDTVALIESKTLTKASVGYQIHQIVEQSTKKSGEKIERTIDGRTFERLLKDHRQVRDGREVGGDMRAFQRSLDEAAGAMERADDDMPVYRVVDWEPLENSLVTVPADPTVGVGRSVEQTIQIDGGVSRADVEAALARAYAKDQLIKEVRQPLHPAALKEKATMAENQAAAGAIAEQKPLPAQVKQGPSAMELETARVRGITAMCKSNKIDDNIREHWVGTGLPLEEISEEILQIVERRSKDTKSVAALGLSQSEVNRFSLFNAIRATADKNWTNAPFELECSREIAKRTNKMTDPNKFYVPFEVQERSVQYQHGQTMAAGTHRGNMLGMARRDLTVGTTTAGGFLVETANMSFIEMLRNRAVAYRMGARRLSGLVGNVTVPKQTSAATAVWLANEASTITESQQVFAQMALTPKTVGAYTEISRQLLLQSSPDAEGIVTSDLASVTALAYDLGVLSGSGASGQPTGITGTAGIGSVSGTGFIAAAFARILEFQTDVAGANVMPAAGGYATTHAVAASMIQAVKYASTASPVWEGNVWDGSMQGFQSMGSNQMAAASMLFGDWSQVVVAEWGVLEIEVNPYANFQAGILGVRAIVSMDCGLRYPAAFSLATSIA